MNHRITHGLVAVVAISLVVAGLAFSFVVTGFARAGGAQAGGERPAARSAIPPIAHPVNENMADCVRCHVPAEMPRSHARYGQGTCLTCHQVAPAAAPSPESETPAASTPAGGTPVATSQPTGAPEQAQPAAVPHPIAAPYDDCVGCHAIGGNLSMPEDHASYEDAEHLASWAGSVPATT